MSGRGTVEKEGGWRDATGDTIKDNLVLLMF